MNFFSRRTALAAISALALAACGDTGADTTPAGDAAVTAGSELGHVKGSADAPVTLIEYASPTCPACKYWHDDIQPVVQSDYIDTGKVKLIFREYPLHAPDVPAYLVAMCAGEDKYFAVLDELFEYQSGIVESAQNGVLKAMLQTIGQRHGIETEADFDACMNNRDLRQQMADIYQ
ncbi:MAG: thioredoxin domain-containing protein, partial [Hyphomonas sp.]